MGTTWIGDQWRRFWFQPSTPLNLGIGRFVFFTLLLLIYHGRDSSAWAAVPEVMWSPIPLFRALHLGAGSEEGLRILDAAWKASLVLSAIGLATRLSTATAFGLGLYLLGLPHNFGKIHHSTAIVVLVMGILAVSRCGDGWSCDSLIRRARGSGAVAAAPEYTWPVRLIWTAMALAMLAAGISKARASGLAWVLSDNMASILISHQYTHSPPTPWGLWVAGQAWLTRMVAAGSMVLELGAPLALVSRRARLVVVPGLLGMQLGIWMMLGVSFASFMTVYVFWVPWEAVAGAVAARARSFTAFLPRTT